MRNPSSRVSYWGCDWGAWIGGTDPGAKPGQGLRLTAVRRSQDGRYFGDSVRADQSCGFVGLERLLYVDLVRFTQQSVAEILEGLHQGVDAE